jgi:two-component system sensor histidine kinase MtrB
MRFDARAWIDRFIRFWRGSLQLRTIIITVVLSGIAVTVIGVYISTSVRTNLFDSRQDQIVAESSRATLRAQEVFLTSAELSADLDLEGVQASASTAIGLSSTATLVGMIRVPNQDSPRIMDDTGTREFLESESSLVSEDLRNAVFDGELTEIHWQSVGIPDRLTGSTEPGITTGSLLDVPSAGNYQLYLVYSLADVEQTLSFVQQTLIFGGIALVALIGAVAYLIVRLVVGPVRVAAETSEKLAAGQLADLSRVQQRFVSDVSHELRTPLTTIRLAGDVLYDQRETFPPATARTAELLHAQTQRFELLLADLLEMSRYDAGAVTLETEPTNIVHLVEGAIDAVSPLAAEKQTELRLVAPGGYFEADVDSRRIRRVLQNLLGNAIDHGEGKPIVVYVDSDADALAIAVRDYGVGMSAVDMARVFDRFWRADPSRQRSTGGTGLGLAISLEDAMVHGGELAVWSEVGEGSCFRLTIPRVRGEALRGSPLDLPPDAAIELRAEEGS